MTVNGSVSEGVERPLRALWRHHRRFRPRVVVSAAAMTANTAADVAPELLLGVAVDIVVRGSDSFAASLFGIESRRPGWCGAILNVIVWVIESATDYVEAAHPGGLLQSVEHDSRVETYANVQQLDVSWHEGSAPGRVLSVISEDTATSSSVFLDVGARVILHTPWTVTFVGAAFAATSWHSSPCWPPAGADHRLGPSCSSACWNRCGRGGRPAR